MIYFSVEFSLRIKADFNKFLDKFIKVIFVLLYIFGLVQKE